MNVVHTLSLILVRHTRTADNDDRISSSQRDVPLNACGLAQANALALALSTREIVAIYTSDLRRARCVAEMIGAHHRSAPLFPDRRLRESDMGTLSGMTKADISALHSDPRFNTHNPEYDFSPVGGEKRTQVISRHRGCLREARMRHMDEHGAVVIVGHGTALRNLLEDLKHPDALHEQGAYTELDLSSLIL